MNFVINVDAGRPASDQCRVELGSCPDTHHHDGDLIYLETRHDIETGREFVCLIYRAPENT